MAFLLKTADLVANTLALLSALAVMVLIMSMNYEVVARYVFGAPTLWAFDISYMLNGVIFLLGTAYALRTDAHVRIDFLSQKMSERAQQVINALVYLLFAAPMMAAFTYVASGKALTAFQTGEVESVSPWAPVMWPFYATIALGLGAFTLQLLAQGLRYLAGLSVPGAHAGEITLEDGRS